MAFAACLLRECAGRIRDFNGFGKHAHDGRVESVTKRVVHRLQLEVDQRIFEARNPASSQMIAEAIPCLASRGVQFTPVEEDVTLIGMQAKCDAVVGDLVGTTQVFEAGQRIAASDNRASVREPQPIPQRALPKLPRTFIGVRRRDANRALARAVAVVVDN